jgi:hypothetical protein
VDLNIHVVIFVVDLIKGKELTSPTITNQEVVDFQAN